MWIKLYPCFFILLGIIGCGTSGESAEVPMIRIDPDAAVSFVASDFFDGYRVLTFKDMICTKIGDFVEVGDKRVASSVVTEGMKEVSTICVFDTTGRYLYPIGAVGRGPGEYLYISPYIELTPDKTILIKSAIGWVEYAVDGQLVKEKRMNNPVYEGLGYMQWRLNDTTLLFKRSDKSGGNREDAYMLQLVSADNFQVRRSFFPMKSTDKFVTRDQLYVYEDTVCFYRDLESCVYVVGEKEVEPRYMLDKGKYAGLTPYEILKKEGHLPRTLLFRKMGENKRYVIGLYGMGKDYYFFFYDKRSQKTYNLKAPLEDDLLLGPIAKVYACWNPGYRMSDDYMYLYFPAPYFSQLLESVRKKLTETEWEAYRQKHPDLMQVYDGLNEESNTVVVGYEFKK